MASVLTESQRASVVKEKQHDDSTIDNGATYTQLIYLARVHQAQPLEPYRDAFLRGLDYLFKAQYENGGWPQYYPRLTGYYKHVTYNDDAMVGVMLVLIDIARKTPAYVFVDEARRKRAERAVQKGIECILKTQVKVQGKRTVWCAQHDELTLLPAPARAFEPISLSGLESVGIVRFLMRVQRPDADVVNAIESAIAWFKGAQLNGIRWVQRPDATRVNGFEGLIVSDEKAPPLWARFYEIGTNRPIFIGRDSVIKYHISEIEEERRNGYRWYTDEPAKLINRDYPAWLSAVKQH